MKRFAFTLEPLLKIKVSMEKQLKNKQAELLQRLTSYYKQIQKTEDEKTKVKEEYLSKFGMTAGDMKIFENHYRSLENKRQDLKRRAEEIKKELARVQKELLDITIEKKTLEKLKVKQYEEYLAELARAGEKELEDIVSGKTAVKGSF